MRVKITFPGTGPLCKLRIPVRIGDINYGGHVGNDALLSLMQEARMKWLAQAGFTELQAGGHGLIMSDVMVDYRGESFYGDVLEIALFAELQTPRSFDLFYRIQVERSGKEVLIAEAKSGMVCFDYAARKIVSISAALQALLAPVVP